MINKKSKGKLFLSFTLILSILGSISMSYGNVLAEDVNDTVGFKNELLYPGVKDVSQIPCMDEEGNITYITEDNPTYVEQVSLFANTGSQDKVVNFRNKKNGDQILLSQTTSYKEAETGNDGYLQGFFGADGAYLGEENGKVKFMLSGVVGLVDSNMVQVSSLAGAHVSNYEVKNGKIIHNISSNLNSEPTSHLIIGPAQPYMKEGAVYYSYDGNYFYTDYSIMLDDYRRERRTRSINPSDPYYNYFQFLPMRSKTDYSASEFNSLLNSNKNITSTSKLYNMGSYIVEMQNKFGVNGLIIASVAANESAWGNSNMAQTKNNLFGLNARDANPGDAKAFRNPQHCINEFAERWMSKEYLNVNDWKNSGEFLGNKGSGINVRYASDPYWGEKAANIAWNLDSKGRDVNHYQIGIKDTINTQHTVWNVRTGSSTSHTRVYKTKTFSNMSFIILGQENDFYKIQSNSVLTGDRKAINNDSGVYDFDKMYLYISKDALQVVNKKTDVKPKPEPEPQPQPGNADLTSAKYMIDKSKNTITGIKDFPVDVSEFTKNLKVTGGSIKVLSSSGSSKTGNIGTGDQVQLLDNSGKVVSTYNVVIYGDTNGDGIVDTLDLLRVKKDILNVKNLEGYQQKAADTSKNGEVDSLDLLQVKKQILGAGNIKQ